MAKSNGTSQPDALSALKTENARLAKENDLLKKQLERGVAMEKPKNKIHFWRKFSIVSLVGIAGAMLVAGNVLFWAGNTLIDNTRYVETVTPLIKNSEIQQTIAQTATTKLFDNVDTEQLISDALPPRADFLAPTLSSQIEQSAQGVILKIVSSDQFETVWIDVMTRTHQRLIGFIENYQGDGTIDLQEVYTAISSRLSDTKLSFLSNKQLPEKIGSITVIDAPRLPIAHNIVTNLRLYQTLAILVVVAACFGAIRLSKNRRKTTITIGLLFAVLMFLTLVSIRLGISALSNAVDPNYSAAANQAATIISQALITTTRALMLLSLFVALIAWISGQSKAAKSLRERTQLLLNGKAHQAIFRHSENSFTLWMGAHKRTLQWIAVAVIASTLLFVRISPVVIFWYGIGILCAVLIVEVLSATNSTASRT